MSNRTYDILAYIGRIFLPACAALYSALSGIWGLPYGEAIVGTLAAVAVFINALLKKESNAYSETGFNRETLDELHDGKGDD